MDQNEMDAPRFGLVIPCFNESRGLAELAQRCRFLAEQGHGEVILVDNGSTDDTPAMMAKALEGIPENLVRSVRVEVNQGYGFGITSGLEKTSAPIVGWTHADLQTDPLDVLRGLQALDGVEQPWFLKGRRFGRPWSDRVFTVGMSIFETVLFRRRMSDINSQPTLVPRELMETWGAAPRDFSLDLFVMNAAIRRGYPIIRIPVLVADRRFGTSSWNVDFAAKRRFIERTVGYSLTLRRSMKGRGNR